MSGEVPTLLKADEPLKEEFKIEVKADPANPRLKLNLPLSMGVYQVIKVPGGPPLAVLCMPCDQRNELMAVGACDKLKILIMQEQKQLDPKLALTTGVKEFAMAENGGFKQ